LIYRIIHVHIVDDWKHDHSTPHYSVWEYMLSLIMRCVSLLADV
jgi:hypothetical protein